jgi:hypothetical protein
MVQNLPPKAWRLVKKFPTLFSSKPPSTDVLPRKPRQDSKTFIFNGLQEKNPFAGMVSSGTRGKAFPL